MGRGGADDFGDLLEVAAGFFDAGDVGAVLGQADGGRSGHIRAGAAGHVVEHDRGVDGVGDGAEVLVEALLRGLVVVGHDLEQAVDADFGGELGGFDGGSGAVGAGAGDEGGVELVDDGQQLAEEDALLFVGEGGGFAGGAGDDDAVGAALDQRDGEGLGLLDVDRAVLAHRRDHGGVEASQSVGGCGHAAAPRSVVVWGFRLLGSLRAYLRLPLVGRGSVWTGLVLSAARHPRRARV